MGSIDVGQVPGISATAAVAMNAVGVFTSSDLLRSNRSGLARAIGASVDDVRNWQAFSQFLEVEGLTPAAAQALMAANIDRLEEFCGKTLTILRTVLQGVTPPLSDDELVQALLSARRLQFTGVLNGTVVTTNDLPLEGATAAIGGQTALSDARGRFRIVGLRIDLPYTVSISHPAKKAKIFGQVSVHPSSALIGRKFKLTGRPAPQQRLSAMNGDVLPPFGTAPVTTEARTEPLSSLDRYALTEFYSNGDGKLGSLFFDFHDGRFVVRTYRVKKGDLPAGSKLRDRMVLEGGKMKITKITARKIGRLTRVQAVKNHYAGKIMTKAMLNEATKLLLKALSDPKGGR